MIKKQSVAIIIPYFGKFPNYFDFWLKSALANKNFDFLIFTDNTEYSTMNNVKFINMNFEDFKKILQEKINFSICLNEPYKICDYRPIFGYALQKYISNYDFWGFGDIDVILGNLSHFITPKILNDYDKIYELGHLTILRNNDQCNNLWKIKHHLKDAYRYDEAFKTPYPCHFDETDGLTCILNLEKIKTYRRIDFADIDRSKFNFVSLGKQDKIIPSLFLWDNGTLFYYFKDKNKISKYEVAYAHFQKRILNIPSNQKIPSVFLVLPNRFSLTSDFEKSLEKEKILRKYPYYRYSRRKEIIKKIKNHAIQQRLYRSLFQKFYRYYLDKQYD